MTNQNKMHKIPLFLKGIKEIVLIYLVVNPLKQGRQSYKCLNHKAPSKF